MQKLKNNEALPRFIGSYKKKSCTRALSRLSAHLCGLGRHFWYLGVSLGVSFSFLGLEPFISPSNTAPTKILASDWLFSSVFFFNTRAIN